MSSIASVLEQVKTKGPLVHNITNYVVMNNTANALLAVGASPVMAHAIEEVKDIVTISSSLVINMGTLSEKWVESMLMAAEQAKLTKTPFVFDPVGVGASAYRTEVAQMILKAATPNVIRGNASEIMALAKLTNSTKGVDSTMDTQDAIEGATLLSKKFKNTVVISGATDYIITGDTVSKIENGNPLMARITGMGCTATAMVGACLGVEENAHLAATAAMAIMGVSGDMANEKSVGPGSFQMNYYDSLYDISPDILAAKVKTNA